MKNSEFYRKSVEKIRKLLDISKIGLSKAPVFIIVLSLFLVIILAK